MAENNNLIQLDEFVTAALTQIVDGVKKAQEILIKTKKVIL